MTKYEQEKRAEKELGAIFIPDSLAVYSPTLAGGGKLIETKNWSAQFVCDAIRFACEKYLESRSRNC